MEPLDDVDWLRANVADEMKARDLIWDGEYPSLKDAPAPDSPTGTIKIIQGRLSSSQRTEFIGPEEDELRFWQRTRHIVVDWAD